ncbi:glycosyltransferase family 2 protein [Candidatus Aerophobetes bacterium]|nr:glycosyltransferase family 2 protein [Candidatus Aerophobetes bacterium]
MESENLKDLSVVIPSFNEEENIKLIYPKLKSTLEGLKKSYEIIFVDDGSTDKTYDFLRKICQDDKNVEAVVFRRNFGQTAAISAGFDYAEGDVIITLDADLQNDPEDIPFLLKKIDDGFDVVSGWRMNRKDPLITKRLPSYISNWLISSFTGVKLHDYGCTLKAYKKEVAKNIKLYGEMHRFIPALAKWVGASICEVKVKHFPRKYGKSKYGFSRIGRGFLDLLTVKFLLIFSTRPIQIFGRFGLISIFLGFFSGIVLIIMKIVHKVDMTGNPFLYLSILFFLVGAQFISMGLLGEIISRTYHESQNKPVYFVKEVLTHKKKVKQ